MTYYNSPSDDVSEYLLNQGVITAGQHFSPYMPAWNELPSNINVVSQVADVNIAPNPKWLRDEVTVQWNVRGRTRNDHDAVMTKAWQIFNYLLGISGFEINGKWYGRFVSNSAPTMNRMGINTDIFASFSFSFLREGQADEGNRVPLE